MQTNSGGSTSVRRAPPAAPHIAIQTFAHTPTHVYHMVELFGGAIIASIPSTWRDVSLVRQVPGELRVMCPIAGKGEDGSIRNGAADIIIITIPLAKNIIRKTLIHGVVLNHVDFIHSPLLISSPTKKPPYLHPHPIHIYSSYHFQTIRRYIRNAWRNRDRCSSSRYWNINTTSKISTPVPTSWRTWWEIRSPMTMMMNRRGRMAL